MHEIIKKILRKSFLIWRKLVRGSSLLRMCSLRLQVFLNRGQLSVSPTVNIVNPVRFQGCGRLIVENNVVFGYALAGAYKSPILLQPREYDSCIFIGQDSQIMNGCEFIARTSIHIGKKCKIGAQTMIIDADFHGIAPEARTQPGKTAPVVIEENVWIGVRAMILKGVHIGKDAIVGANCVVAKDVPEGAIVAGNPMRIIGSVYQTMDKIESC